MAEHDGTGGTARAGLGLICKAPHKQRPLWLSPGLLSGVLGREAGRFGPQRSQKQEKTLRNTRTKALPILRDPPPAAPPPHQEGSQRKCPAPGSRIQKSWKCLAPPILCSGASEDSCSVFFCVGEGHLPEHSGPDTGQVEGPTI